MGRELKRVPLDFKWPLNQVWKGYLNPYSFHECKACDGTGESRESKALSDSWYNFKSPTGKGWNDELTQDEVDALVKADRLFDLTRVPLNEKQKKDLEEKIKNGGNSWLPYNNGHKPTAEEVNQMVKERKLHHDCINRWICVEQRAKRLGITNTKCEFCNGDGGFYFNDKIKKAEKFKPVEPPIGEGYQLWETTSEGSPVSPVFTTLDELCEWCEDNATTFGNCKTTKEKWKQMLEDNFVVHKEKIGNNTCYFS